MSFSLPDLGSPHPEVLSPTPDWRTSRVITVDPTCWKYTRAPAIAKAFESSRSALAELGVTTDTLTAQHRPADIWIRDWGPAAGTYFRFSPSYAPGLYPLALVERARVRLNRLIGEPMNHSDLVLDGGNLVHNGRSAILTDKVLKDNPTHRRDEIIHSIQRLGFERVILIPVEPDDVIGHVDGVLRFVTPDVLLVNDYAGTDLKEYGQHLLEFLRNANVASEIIPFPWFTTGKKRSGVWSAEGCYINFLQVSQGIVMPSFENDRDDAASTILSQFGEVRTVNATSIAELGGVLNCVSFNW